MLKQPIRYNPRRLNALKTSDGATSFKFSKRMISLIDRLQKKTVSLLTENESNPFGTIKTENMKTANPLDQAAQVHTRKDNILEKLLIFVLSFVLYKISPIKFGSATYLKTQPLIRFGMSFDDFVAVSKTLFRTSSSTMDVKVRIVTLLRDLIPQFIRDFFRLSYQSNPQWICEKSSQFMSFGAFGWLVGDTERFEINRSELDTFKKQSLTNITDNILLTTDNMGDVYGSQSTVYSFVDPITPSNLPSNSFHMNNTDGLSIDESSTSWKSGVKLIECRYLAQSGCKALCLHLCKAPTQQFFLQELGVPLYMKPDFKTNSCEMMFGVMPPKEDVDPAFQESCFTSCFNNFKNKSTNSHEAINNNVVKLKMLQNNSIPLQMNSNMTAVFI